MTSTTLVPSRSSAAANYSGSHLTLVSTVDELQAELVELRKNKCQLFEDLDAPATTAAKQHAVADGSSKLTICDFCQWLDFVAQQLDNVCYCDPLNNGSAGLVLASSAAIVGLDVDSVLQRHQKLQAEIESRGRRFIQAIAASGSQAARSLLAGEERRWQYLWLRSLEYLLILEQASSEGLDERLICPRHYYQSGGSNSSPLNSATGSPYLLNASVGCGSATLPTASGRGGKQLSSEDVSGEDQRASTEFRLSQSVCELATMRSRRVQTAMDAYYTPLTGLTRQLNSSKRHFEIVNKDIGYSSDADMSDVGAENRPSTTIAHSNSSDHVNTVGAASSGASTSSSSRSSRKRSVRRRRAIQQRSQQSIRPWSFHDGWTDWDYYQPPSYASFDKPSPGQSGSMSQLAGDGQGLDQQPDEHILRSLTEFGENYEFWFKNEDDAIIRASTPVREIEQCQPALPAVPEPSPVAAQPPSPPPHPSPAPQSNASVQTCSSSTDSSTDPTPTQPSARQLQQLVYTYKELGSGGGTGGARRSRAYVTVLMALSIFTLFVSMLGGGVSLQKMYPYRPPPC